MDRTVEAALRAPTDYSPAFTAEVARLADHVREVVGAFVEHGQDMSYAHSQTIVVSAAAGGRLVSQRSHDSVTKVNFYVSAKAKLFAVHVFASKTPTNAAKEWVLLSESAGEPPWSEVAQQASAVLESEGYRRLSGSVLSELAPGHVTEMDGVPATVFEVLFAEIL